MLKQAVYMGQTFKVPYKLENSELCILAIQNIYLFFFFWGGGGGGGGVTALMVTAN